MITVQSQFISIYILFPFRFKNPIVPPLYFIALDWKKERKKNETEYWLNVGPIFDTDENWLTPEMSWLNYVEHDCAIAVA